MRKIQLTQREARMLRDTLAGNKDGYDFLDLKKLDWLCGKLTTLMGDYATRVAELARAEKTVRKQMLRGQLKQASGDEALAGIGYDYEDANELAERTACAPLMLEDADYKLIQDNLAGVKWIGLEDARPTILSMMAAIEGAESGEGAMAPAPPDAEAAPEGAAQGGVDAQPVAR